MSNIEQAAEQLQASLDLWIAESKLPISAGAEGQRYYEMLEDHYQELLEEHARLTGKGTIEFCRMVAAAMQRS